MMMPASPLPLPDDWEACDSHDSYFEAIRSIGASVKAGTPLPEMFIPSKKHEDDKKPSDYETFLAAKTPVDAPSGMNDIPVLPSALKPFQAAIVSWALRRGRAAVFAGTGLGKTAIQLSWARAVADHEKTPILILTPLAVAEQTVAEAKKFGIKSVAYAPDQDHTTTDIVVSNYERFEKFDIDQFVGIVLDESGLIKSADGKTRAILTDACRNMPWRLCCTATPAPNDYTELGQHAEFLGIISAKEMLSMYFVHDGSIRANDHSQGANGWRLKRHATHDFWRWLASWAVVIRHPSDLGFDEPGYDLPPLNLHQITVAAEYKPTGGFLFLMPASTLGERIRVRRDTIEERAAAAFDIIRKHWMEVGFRDKLAECGSQNIEIDDANGITPTPPNASVGSRKGAIRKKTGNTCETITNLEKKSGINEPLNSGNVSTRPGAKDTLLTPNIENWSRQELEPFLAVHRKPNVTGVLSRNTELRSKNMTSCSMNKEAVAQSATGKTETDREDGCTSIIVTKPASFAACYAPIATSPLANSETIETSCIGQSNICLTPPERLIIWCKLNKEQDRLESMLKDTCFSVYGSLPNEEKIDRIGRWLKGERPILLSKPRIFGYGMNLQCCAKMIFVGADDSFEQIYQAIRRCWRFGQTKPVDVYFVSSELEGAVVANLKRKERAFDEMLDAMSDHMRDLMKERIRGGHITNKNYNPTKQMKTPEWLLRGAN